MISNLRQEQLRKRFDDCDRAKTILYAKFRILKVIKSIYHVPFRLLLSEILCFILSLNS